MKRRLTALPHHGLSYAVLQYLAADPHIRQALQPPRPQKVSFNYLGQLDADQTEHGLLRLTDAPAGTCIGLDNDRHVALDINCFVTGGRLRVDWSYSRDQYDEATITALAERFNAHLAALVQHCCTHIRSAPVSGVVTARVGDPLVPLRPKGLVRHSFSSTRLGAWPGRIVRCLTISTLTSRSTA